MPTSVAQFLDQLRSTNLVSEDELRALELDELTADRARDAEPLAQRLVREKKLTLFQATQLYRGRGTALILGNYLVLEKLGQGGMGIVYKARHRLMDRVVALKVLPAALTKDDQAVRRFQREVRAAAQLAHPNIVTAFDADQAQGNLYLVMEYVDGQDLGTLLRQRGRLGVADAVNYILQAAKGLEYAHGMGVIHRDIKPSNLLLSREGVVKVLDLGLARCNLAAVGAMEDELTRSGQMLGTVDYMAPEQSYDTREADERSDIYSLGCTLYRLLTGEAPYGGETAVQRVMAHRDAPIPSARERRPEISPRLDALCRRMMAKRPEDRPASMREVIEELKGVSEGAGLALSDDGGAVDDLPVLSAVQGDTLPTFVMDGATPPDRSFAQPASQALPGQLVIGSWFAGNQSSKSKRRFVVVGAALGVLIVAAMAVAFYSSSETPKGGRQAGALTKADSPQGTLPDTTLKIDEKVTGEGVTRPAVTSASSTRRVLIVVPWEGFWVGDYQPVRDRLESADVEISVASSQPGLASGRNNFVGPDTAQAMVTLTVSEAIARIGEFDALYFVGKPPQAGINEFASGGRQAEAARRLVRAAIERGKIVSSLCRGTVVLHGTGVLEGRMVSRGRYIKDIAGDERVQWQGKAVVRDDPLLTGADPEDAREFAEQLIEMLREARGNVP